MGSELMKTMEKMYPECTDALMNNFDDAYNLWCRKQSDYGDGNIRLGLNITNKESSLPSTRTNRNLLLSQFGVVVRMNDKIQRIMNLYKKKLFDSHSEVFNETIDDTCLDIMNYANMLMVLKKGKWGK